MRQAAAAGSGVSTGSTDRSEFTKRIFFLQTNTTSVCFPMQDRFYHQFGHSTAGEQIWRRWTAVRRASTSLTPHKGYRFESSLRRRFPGGICLYLLSRNVPSALTSSNHLFCLNQIFMLSFLVSIHFFYLFFKTGSWILHHVLIEISKPTNLSTSAQLSLTVVHYGPLSLMFDLIFYCVHYHCNLEGAQS